MNHSENRLVIVSKLTSAINQHSADEVKKFFTPDVSISRGNNRLHTGQQVMVDMFRRLLPAFPDLRLILTRCQSLDKNAVIAEWTLLGTQLGEISLEGRNIDNEPSGRVVQTVFAALLSFDKLDMVKHVAVHGDTSALLTEPPPPPKAKVNPLRIQELASRQTAAWDNHDARALANNYAETGWIIINGGTPWAGRAGLVAMASSYMESFPDLAMTMKSLHIASDRAVWSWNLTGTNTGPGGTGNAVNFGGYEVWRINEDCLIAESYGYYDSAAYLQQLANGAN